VPLLCWWSVGNKKALTRGAALLSIPSMLRQQRTHYSLLRTRTHSPRL